jgi:hypothetical protein
MKTVACKNKKQNTAMFAWQYRPSKFVEQRYSLNRLTKAKFQSISWFGIKTNIGGEDKLHTML